MKRIAVIGAGNVGAHIISYAIARDVPAEFILVDINQKLEAAQVLDLKDGALFSRHTQVQGCDFGDPLIEDVDIIVITAGANQKPGETRCELLGKNAQILATIAQKIGKIKPSALVILVTNPVDVLTHLACNIFDLPHTQILGTGTLLDSSRLQWRLVEKTQLRRSKVDGYVLGEHGDSEFVAWSTVQPEIEFSDQEKQSIEKSVREQAYDIIEGKGATYFGIGASTVQLLSAIIDDTKEIFPVSANLTGQYGLDDVALGVPAVIGKDGVEEIQEIPLIESEQKKLELSAQKLKDLYKGCKWKD